MTDMPPLVFHHEVSACDRLGRPVRNNLGRMHRTGPFTGMLCPTEALRRGVRYPDFLYAGLMATLPRPDGIGAVEIEGSGYERQAIRLQPRDQEHFFIPERLEYRIVDCPAAVGLALFNRPSGGEIVAYGALISSRVSEHPIDHVQIAGHAILVKRCSPPGPGTL